MSQRNNPYHVRDTTLLTGWLFADLLLGLMMIFLVTIPHIPSPPPPPPPVLTVSPNSLMQGTMPCTADNSRCTVMVGETLDSQGDLHWTTSSDMNDIHNTKIQVKFSPAEGDLLPGQEISVTITNFPCQNGSFTFRGSRGAVSVTISWQCKPQSVLLDLNPNNFILTVNSPSQFANGDTSQDQDIKNQVMSQSFLRGRRVGLVIAYGGALGGNQLITQAQNIAKHIYTILHSLANNGSDIGKAFQGADYYVTPTGPPLPSGPPQPLFNLDLDPHTVEVQVYLFTQ